MNRELVEPVTVSVVIPVYNDQVGINRCLTALKKQTLLIDYFEVIIVDNKSDSAMKNLVAPELNSKIISCPTKGSYAARNMGVRHATNSIVAFLDADCLPMPEWLANGISALQKAPSHTIIGGEVKLTQSKNPTLVEQYQCLTGFGQQDNIESKMFTATANIFVKHTDFYDIGFFEERLLSGGDREWSWRAENKGYTITYSNNTIVSTPARKSLKAAIIQARRVTGGRHHFKQFNLIKKSLQEQRLSPKRNSFESVLWLLKRPGISLLIRIKIIGIASLLKIIQLLEKLKLDLGGAPERS